MKHLWISLPYATFLISYEGVKVTQAPPIARWTIGKDPEWVFFYYLRKGARICQVFL